MTRPPAGTEPPDDDLLPRRSVCVVVHDVASATLPACDRLIRAIDEVAPVPLTLLAVPRYHCAPRSPSLIEWLMRRSDVGDEIALHGYTHQDDGRPRGVLDRLKRMHYTRGEGEFAALTLSEAMRRITSGLRWLTREGLAPRGFVAPAWLLSADAWEALRWQPFGYTCTLRQLVLLPERRVLTSQSVVYSCDNAWRRQASVWWNAGVARATRRNPLLRIELHPRDADHAAIRRSWQKILEDALADRHPATLGDVAEAFRIRTDWDSFDARPLEPEPPLHDDEHEAGGEPADERTGGDVARVMQPEHHA